MAGLTSICTVLVDPKASPALTHRRPPTGAVLARRNRLSYPERSRISAVHCRKFATRYQPRLPAPLSTSPFASKCNFLNALTCRAPPFLMIEQAQRSPRSSIIGPPRHLNPADRARPLFNTLQSPTQARSRTRIPSLSTIFLPGSNVQSPSIPNPFDHDILSSSPSIISLNALANSHDEDEDDTVIDDDDRTQLKNVARHPLSGSPVDDETVPLRRRAPLPPKTSTIACHSPCPNGSTHFSSSSRWRGRMRLILASHTRYPTFPGVW